jgi:hypothetical protein
MGVTADVDVGAKARRAGVRKARRAGAKEVRRAGASAIKSIIG